VQLNSQPFLKKGGESYNGHKKTFTLANTKTNPMHRKQTRHTITRHTSKRIREAGSDLENLHFFQLSAWTGLGWMTHWTDQDKLGGMGLNPFEGTGPESLQTGKQTNEICSLFTCSMDRKWMVGSGTTSCKLLKHFINNWAIPSIQLLTMLGHPSDNFEHFNLRSKNTKWCDSSLNFMVS
jgi:hypothetical protein